MNTIDTEQDKELIDAFLTKYQDSEYFNKRFFTNISSDDILEHVETRDVYNTFGDDILEEIPEDEIITYLEKYGYKILSDKEYKDLVGKTDENMKKQLLVISRTLSPKSILDKKDIKRVINEYIDFCF